MKHLPIDAAAPIVWTDEKGVQRSAAIIAYWLLEDGARLILKDAEDCCYLGALGLEGGIKVILDPIHIDTAIKAARLILSGTPPHMSEGKVIHALAMGVMAGIAGGEHG